MKQMSWTKHINSPKADKNSAVGIISSRGNRASRGDTDS